MGWAARPEPFPKPQAYSLGPLTKPAKNRQIDLAPHETDIVVTAQRRAPMSTIWLPLNDTARAVWNIGGNPLIGQPDCQPFYTTVGGQPGSPADLGGPVGVRGCFF